MSKSRLAAFAAMLTCALLLGSSGVASAQTTATEADFGQNAVPITGTKKNGKQFSGTYRIQRFENVGDTVYSVGVLKGRVKGKMVRRSGVRLPVTNFADAATTAQLPGGTCRILTLDLGPLDLNLLGLRIQLNAIHLRITGQTGEGNLLGNLLCAIAGLLDPPALSGLNLSAILNSLLGLVPRTA